MATILREIHERLETMPQTWCMFKLQPVVVAAAITETTYEPAVDFECGLRRYGLIAPTAKPRPAALYRPPHSRRSAADPRVVITNDNRKLLY